VRAETNAKTWECFERHLLQRKPSGDVAATLGISASAVRQNGSRVLARIRELCLIYDEQLDEPKRIGGREH